MEEIAISKFKVPFRHRAGSQDPQADSRYTLRETGGGGCASIGNRSACHVDRFDGRHRPNHRRHRFPGPPTSRIGTHCANDPSPRYAHLAVDAVGARADFPARQEALTTPGNELWLSPISTWEILLLSRKGRRELDPDPGSWIATALARTPCREAPVTHDVSLELERIVLPHRDPADLLLAATARAYRLTLVTADENLLRGSGYSVLANR